MALTPEQLEKRREYGRRYDAAHRDERRQKHNEWRAANPDKARAATARWAAANPHSVRASKARTQVKHKVKIAARQRVKHLNLRVRIFAHYGLACECCGDEHFAFLTLDHPNNDGKADRKIHGSGSRFYMSLERRGYPAGYRVLCMNCNCARQWVGECPHEAERREAA